MPSKLWNVTTGRWECRVEVTAWSATIFNKVSSDGCLTLIHTFVQLVGLWYLYKNLACKPKWGRRTVCTYFHAVFWPQSYQPKVSSLPFCRLPEWHSTSCCGYFYPGVMLLPLAVLCYVVSRQVQACNQICEPEVENNPGSSRTADYRWGCDSINGWVFPRSFGLFWMDLVWSEPERSRMKPIPCGWLLLVIYC